MISWSWQSAPENRPVLVMYYHHVCTTIMCQEKSWDCSLVLSLFKFVCSSQSLSLYIHYMFVILVCLGVVWVWWQSHYFVCMYALSFCSDCPSVLLSFCFWNDGWWYVLWGFFLLLYQLCKWWFCRPCISYCIRAHSLHFYCCVNALI